MKKTQIKEDLPKLKQDIKSLKRILKLISSAEEKQENEKKLNDLEEELKTA